MDPEASFERAEERRYNDMLHKRETRAVSGTIITLAVVFTIAVYFMAQACDASWQRGAELQRQCLAQKGTWVDMDQGKAGCSFRPDDE